MTLDERQGVTEEVGGAERATRGPTFQSMTIASGVRSSARRTPHKVAVIDGDRSTTFAELVDRMDRLSTVLARRLRLSPGDRAAVISPNCQEYFDVDLALAQSGVVLVHISTRASGADIEFICRDAEVKTLFVHESAVAALDGLDLPEVGRVTLGTPEYEALLADAVPEPPAARIEEWETFCIFYTSGTTGKPKGVLVPHRSRVLNYFQMASEYGCYGPDDHSLAIAPMSHGAGQSFAIAPIFFGGTTTVHRRFDPLTTLAALATGTITNVFVVPTLLRRIFALPPEQLGERPAGLRRIVSNAAPLSDALKQRVVEHFGPGLLFECYGSTEAGIVCNLAPADQLTRPGSVGRAFPCTEIRILDADGNDVPPGEVGELHSSSPALFNGYLHVPLDETPGLRGAWFSAGDLARQDADGYVSIVGRRDDKIITGGLNVYPREIEDVLMAHPGVDEAVVHGAPDDDWGEAVVAAVTLRPGSAVSQSELQERCRQSLARYKVPKDVIVLPSMPRNAAGKILRREVVATSAAVRAERIVQQDAADRETRP